MALYDEFTTPSKVNAQIDARLNGQKGEPLGIPPLNSDGIVPSQFIDVTIPVKEILDIEKDVAGGVSANDTATLNLNNISDLSTVPRRNRTRAYVNDTVRGGMFTYVASGLTANGGTIFAANGGGYWVRNQVKDILLNDYGFSQENIAAENASIFQYVQTIAPNGSKFSIKAGIYNMDDVIIYKSGFYNFEGVQLINNMEVAGDAIKIDSSVDGVFISGGNLVYTGIFYHTNPLYPGTKGVAKYGINFYGKNLTIENFKASGFSYTAIKSDFISENLTIINCNCSNNGYSGINAQSKNSTVIGGVYDENGGTNPQDGYGVIGNVGAGGIFKCIGVTARRNRTRNIDSHTGEDIVVEGCYTDYAGISIPQWFNDVEQNGHGIRITKAVKRAVICNNITSNCSNTGIMFDASSPYQSTSYVESIIISNNRLDFNLYGINVRSQKTNEVTIIGNQIRSEPTGLTRGILITPIEGSDFGYLNNLNILGNIVNDLVFINFTESLEAFTVKMNMNNNIFSNGCTIVSGKCKVIASISSNSFVRFIISKGDIGSIVRFNGNTVDYQSITATQSISTLDFIGKLIAENNSFLRISASIAFVVYGNSFFRDNVFSGFNFDGLTTFAIRVYPNAEFTNNKIEGDIEINTGIRFTPESSVRIFGNYGNFTRDRMDASSGPIYSTRTHFDPKQGFYDLNFISTPVLGDYVFLQGDRAKNRNPTTKFEGWVYTNSQWKPYGDLSYLEPATAAGANTLNVKDGILVTSASSFVGTPGPRFYRQSEHGTVIQAFTGSVNDFALMLGAGTIKMAVPTGTQNVAINGGGDGNLLVGTTTDSGEKLNINGTVRIQSIPNGTGNFSTYSATGVMQQRTPIQSADDILKAISGYSAGVAQKLEHDSSGNIAWVNV